MQQSWCWGIWSSFLSHSAHVGNIFYCSLLNLQQVRTVNVITQLCYVPSFHQFFYILHWGTIDFNDCWSLRIVILLVLLSYFYCYYQVRVCAKQRENPKCRTWQTGLTKLKQLYCQSSGAKTNWKLEQREIWIDLKRHEAMGERDTAGKTRCKWTESINENEQRKTEHNTHRAKDYQNKTGNQHLDWD